MVDTGILGPKAWDSQLGRQRGGTDQDIVDLEFCEDSHFHWLVPQQKSRLE